jgi:hypothetical protein
MILFSSLQQAASQRGRTPAQQRPIEFALNRFARKHRALVHREAGLNFAIADLALSFPALLFVIAVKHPGIDADALRQRVIAGQSLKALARAAGLPMWLRKLKPQAFEDLLVHVPQGDLVSRQITNFIPRKSKDHARWLWRVSHACRWGHEGFALWMARMWKTAADHKDRDCFEMLSLWAWYSTRPNTEFGRLVQKRWRMDIDWKQAVAACNSWIDSVNLHLLVHIEPRPPKMKERTVGGFDFVHLATSEMLADEAVAMRNCIKTYGYDVAHKDVELWSIRKDGQRIATLEIGTSDVDGLPGIRQVKHADNAPVRRDVALVARRWFEMHDIEGITIVDRKLPCDASRRAWQRGFKPYWIAKGRIPNWLPLVGSFELSRISSWNS